MKLRLKIAGVVCASAMMGAGVFGATATTAAKKPATASTAAHNTAASTASTKAPANSKTAHTTKGVSAKSKKRAPKVRGQAAPTPDRISEIQTALAKSGAYKGDPSGKWDDGSVDAMKHFQQQNGLAPSGKLDAQTLQKLGLGSDIAGRSAPRPQSSAGTTAIRNL